MKRREISYNLRSRNGGRESEAPKPTRIVSKQRPKPPTTTTTSLRKRTSSGTARAASQESADVELPDVDCAICLDTKPKPAKVVFNFVPCGHKFHSDCIETWLKKKNRCPVCRFPIFESTPRLADLLATLRMPPTVPSRAVEPVSSSGQGASQDTSPQSEAAEVAQDGDSHHVAGVADSVGDLDGVADEHGGDGQSDPAGASDGGGPCDVPSNDPGSDSNIVTETHPSAENSLVSAGSSKYYVRMVSTKPRVLIIPLVISMLCAIYLFCNFWS